MELYGHYRQGLHLDGLYYPIGAASRDTESTAEAIDGLMVRTVDHQVGSIEHVMEAAAFGYHDLMDTLPLHVGTLVQVDSLAIEREVLPQRTTEGYIDQLQATADAHDGQPHLAGCTEQLHLEGITAGIGRRAEGRLLAVAPGFDVCTSTYKHEDIDLAKQLLASVMTLGIRKYERYMASTLHGINVRTGYARVINGAGFGKT